MNTYQNNLQILKRSSRVLYEMLLREKDRFEVKMESIDMKDNMMLEYEGKRCFLHSVYDVEHEMENMFRVMDKEDRMVVLFGLGSGYALKYIARNYPNVDKVVVIEPSLSLFKDFLEKKNLKEYVQGMGVSFCVNKSHDFMGIELGKYMSEGNSKLIHHVTYRTLFDSYYKEMLKITKKILVVREGNYNFQRNANKIVMINSLVNADYSYSDVDKLREIIRGKPMVVVGAGPSLNKNMHLLNEIKDKAVIIAVGTAIKILDSNGITPHFRMAFDPSPLEMKIVDGIDTEATPIIYSNSLYYDIIPNYKGPKICVDISSNYFSMYLSEVFGRERYEISTGSSILVSAMSMGAVFGSSKIIFIGADLSYSGKKAYAQGAGEDRETVDELDRKENSYDSVDIYGNPVYMSKGFYSVKVGLEQVIKKNKQVQFIDATEGGVKKEGALIKTLKKVIEEDLTDIYDFADMNQVFEVPEEDKRVFEQKMMDVTQELVREIESIELLNEEKIKRLKILNKNINKGIGINAAIIELKSMKVYLDELLEFKTYKYIIKPSLNNIFDAIWRKHNYSGDDKAKEAESLLKKNLAIFSETVVFTELLKDGCNLKKEGRIYDFMKSNLKSF